MSFKDYLTEVNKSPQKGDLVYTPKSHKTPITSDIGFVDNVHGKIVAVRIGGPVPIEIPLSNFVKPEAYKEKGYFKGMTVWTIKE